jgi:quercetin dioxygenase-like cupin family protein
MYVSKKLFLFNTQVKLLNVRAIISGGHMRIKQYAEVEATHFDSREAKAVAARVVIGKKDDAQNFYMRVFTISPGGHTPKHTHDWEHEMFVHVGTGEIFGNGQWHPMKPGNVVFIPANEVHQMKNTGQELLVVVCLVPAHAPEL